MQISSDTMAFVRLHYPTLQPLSFLGRLLLPHEWRISQQAQELELPDDPIELLNEVCSKHTGEIGQPAPLTGQSDTTNNGTLLTKSDLIEFAIQTWRLQRRVQDLDPVKFKREYKQFSDSVRRFTKFLERFDVEIEDPIGKPFTTGWLEVEVVSWDEPGDEESPVDSGPWVKQTISPIIRQHGITIKTGQIVCVDIEE